MFSATRIQTIRKSKGFSQELLAEESGVSLRTIQRVEQGATVPRGHTMQALAAALGVALDDFRAEPKPLAAPILARQSGAVVAVVPAPEAKLLPALHAPAATPASAALPADPEFVQLLNLSALSFLVLPLLNIVVPLLLWRRRRHTTAQVAEVGRRVLGFQVLWQVGCVVAYLLVALAQGVAAHYQHRIWRGSYVAVFVLSYGLNVGVIGYKAWRLRQAEQDMYPGQL